jgi:DNA/RNA-binding domain of Phe-tRNA-synthetase-like protein
MIPIRLSELLVSQHPGFVVAASRVIGVANDRPSPETAAILAGVPEALKAGGPPLLARTEAMARFYKRLKADNRYHIQSLMKAVLNGRKQPSINPVVDVFFAIEVECGVLMSLHDVGRIRGEVVIEPNAAGRRMRPAQGGAEIPLKREEIVICDGDVVMAALTAGLGFDHRVTPESTDVLALAYGCPEESETDIVRAAQLFAERVTRACGGTAEGPVILRTAPAASGGG